jgi:beta-lactam-binding protein with PASTA domain
VRKGRVISSKPAAGTHHRRGTRVAVTISSGR